MFLEFKREGEVVAPPIALPAERTWRDVLRDAADILERDGWCKNCYAKTNDRGGTSHCVIGAIYAVGYSNPYERLPLRLRVAEAKMNTWAQHAGYPNVLRWNDTRGPYAAAEVIAALRAVAQAGE